MPCMWEMLFHQLCRISVKFFLTNCNAISWPPCILAHPQHSIHNGFLFCEVCWFYTLVTQTDWQQQQPESSESILHQTVYNIQFIICHDLITGYMPNAGHIKTNHLDGLRRSEPSMSIPLPKNVSDTLNFKPMTFKT